MWQKRNIDKNLDPLELRETQGDRGETQPNWFFFDVFLEGYDYGRIYKGD